MEDFTDTTDRLSVVSFSDAKYFTEFMRSAIGATAVVDQECNIYYSNSIANSILSQGEFLSSDNNSIICADEFIDQRLRAALSSYSLSVSQSSSENINVLVPKRNRSGNYVLTFSGSWNLSNPVTIDISQPQRLFILRMIDDSDIHQSDEMYMASLNSLSLAEKKVLDLVVDGQSNKQISEHQGVSMETVKSHVTWILKKTGSANRAVLIRKTISLCGIDH